MQSPAAEWAMAIGHLAALDYLRSVGDADHDTLSEVIRSGVARHPQGRAALALALAVGAAWFYRHIVKDLEDM